MEYISIAQIGNDTFISKCFYNSRKKANAACTTHFTKHRHCMYAFPLKKGDYYRVINHFRSRFLLSTGTYSLIVRNIPAVYCSRIVKKLL